MIIYICEKNIFYSYFIIKYYELKIFFYSFLIGNGIAGVFWFSYNLIFISLMLGIIIFIIKNNIVFLLISSIPIYLYNNSDYYNNFFLNYKKIVVFSNRPLASTYILGVIGFSLSHFKMIDKIKKKNFFLIICCSTFSILFILYYEKVNKFHFSSYLFSISLIVLFTNLPFYKLKIENITKQISLHTGGIYYIHKNINLLIHKHFILKYNLRTGTITICIVDYLICYMLCFIGFRIIKKNKLKYLFI